MAILLIDKNFDNSLFGIIYVSMQLVAIFSNHVFSKLKYSLKREAYTVILMSIIFMIAVLSSKYIFLIGLFLFQLPFNVYMIQLDLDIQQHSDNKNMSSIISLIGTLSNITSIIILWLFAILLKQFLITHLAFLTMFLFSVSTLILLRIKNKYV